ncbi:MAG: hypothetical protein AB1568_05835 [Thermodesulfobacteriota bacterium]
MQNASSNGTTSLPRPSYNRILLADAQRAVLIDHCLRKLRGEYLDGEAKEKKAYGLLAGTVKDTILTVSQCLPLHKNARAHGPFRKIMDAAMDDFAVPSETPLDQRGWVADPAELMGAIRRFHAGGLQLVGTYHMHRVGWPHDPLRDTPTALDTRLATGSGLVMLIISVVRPDAPIIRAFYDGISELEIPIHCN